LNFSANWGSLRSPHSTALPSFNNGFALGGLATDFQADKNMLNFDLVEAQNRR
jgi:hypothetical protein